MIHDSCYPRKGVFFPHFQSCVLLPQFVCGDGSSCLLVVYTLSLSVCIRSSPVGACHYEVTQSSLLITRWWNHRQDGVNITSCSSIHPHPIHTSVPILAPTSTQRPPSYPIPPQTRASCLKAHTLPCSFGRGVQGWGRAPFWTQFYWRLMSWCFVRLLLILPGWETRAANHAHKSRCEGDSRPSLKCYSSAGLSISLSQRLR